jgi:hydrogenase maturation protease
VTIQSSFSHQAQIDRGNAHRAAVSNLDEQIHAGRILILGLGNTLLGDDGLGVHVVDRLRQTYDGGVLDFVDGGTLGFRLASLLAGYPACIVVDAAELRAPPGTIKTLGLTDLMDWFLKRQRSSVHEAGLIDLLTLLHLEDKLPRRLAIVAIQPGRLEWYETLSDPAIAALPGACAAVLEVARQWR